MVDLTVLGVATSLLSLVDVVVNVLHYWRVFGNCQSSCGLRLGGIIRRDSDLERQDPDSK